MLQLFNYPVLKPKLKNRAYLSTKALLHLIIQRQCMGQESDKDGIAYVVVRFAAITVEWCRGDSDLELTLCIIDYTSSFTKPGTSSGEVSLYPMKLKSLFFTPFNSSLPLLR